MTLLTDTHCHIHDPEFFPDGGEAEYTQALASDIHRVICPGTDRQSSQSAVAFAARHAHAYAGVGIHPHDSEREYDHVDDFLAWCKEQAREKLVVVGEIGLDYHYMHSPRATQIAVLERQIDLALQLDLPISFHIREAFEDFWAIFGNFRGIKGVLHSFTDTRETMERGVENGLFIGVNGIVTFSEEVRDVVRVTPLEKIVLETDAPYLTPAPLRGKINVPGNVGIIASYVAALRGITVEELSQRTETAVSRLFF